MSPADPRPARRHKASSEEWTAIRSAKKPKECRVCGVKSGLSLHHLVPKSLGGDDVEANLVWLCGDGTTGHHGLVETRDRKACAALRDSLSQQELGYILARKSVAYLDRYYGREAA